jgi:hypothetical protein
VSRTTDEQYTAQRFRVDHVADPSDGFAGDNGLFNASNVEGVLGTFTYDNVYFSTAPSQAHVNVAVPFLINSWQAPLPGRPIYIVKNGFKSDDTIYGGCLRIAVPKQPNSSRHQSRVDGDQQPGHRRVRRVRHPQRRRGADDGGPLDGLDFEHDARRLLRRHLLRGTPR